MGGPAIQTTDAARPSRRDRLALGLVAAIPLAVFLKNYWLNEDAFILLRSLEQLAAGRGPVWNRGERVQVYTSAAWYWLLALVNAPIGNVFTSIFVASVLALAGCIWLVWRWQRSVSALALVLALWLASKGWFDYTSSGLENCIGYLVLIGLYTRCAPAGRAPQRPIARADVALLAGLVPLVRHDLLPLALPAVYLMLREPRVGVAAKLRVLCLAAVPLGLWTLFSLTYYGAPLPNTVYAKLGHGMSMSRSLALGVEYLTAHLWLDPITIVLCLASPVVAFLFGSREDRAFAVGIVAYLACVCVAGGDYMAGRFLSFPYTLASLIGAAAVLREPARRPRRLLVSAFVLAAYVAIVPDTPLLTPFGFGKGRPDIALTAQAMKGEGIYDARVVHYDESLAAWWRRDETPGSILYLFIGDGTQIRASKVPIAARGAVGLTGYYAGLDVYLVDYYALTEPFLARLPASFVQARGHYERAYPRGYMRARRTGETRFMSEEARALYEQVELLTRAPELFSRERWLAILGLNLPRWFTCRVEALAKSCLATKASLQPEGAPRGIRRGSVADTLTRSAGSPSRRRSDRRPRRARASRAARRRSAAPPTA